MYFIHKKEAESKGFFKNACNKALPGRSLHFVAAGSCGEYDAIITAV